MVQKAPANPAAREPTVKRHFEFSRIFKSGRMLGYFIIWVLFFAIAAALLGLVSEQVHKHGGQNTFDYPGQEYGHAMGLLLFTAIFALIVSIFHWAFSTRVYLILFVITGVFAGTGAGILHQSPFGKSLNCQKPDSFFPEAYQPYIGDCARVMAISGLAWALFGLSIIGLVYSFFDHFKLSVRNSKVYDIEKEPTIIEKNLDRTESGNTAHSTTA